MAHRVAHNRQRSSSDPFQDQIYVAPHVSYADNVQPPRSAPLQAPNPPPKVSSTRKPRHPTESRDPRMLEAAVREAVIVRTVDQSPRSKMIRSHTANVPSGTIQPPAHHRAFSQDSVTQAANIVEKARKAARQSKKGSTHADVIDRMDYSSVGPMFHHDGPFDACAPSRNRHKNKAPMLAWSSTPTGEQDNGKGHLRHDRRPLGENFAGRHDSPYPPFTFSEVAQTLPDNKQVDRIAEIWGLNTPEPYEEFFSGGISKTHGDSGPTSAASSLRGGKDGLRGTALNGSRRGLDRDGSRDQRVLNEAPHLRRITTRHNLPPPAPIVLPETNQVSNGSGGQSLPSPGLANNSAPKRTKSLMHRIRKMRDAPNVPVDTIDSNVDVSPSSSTESNDIGAEITHDNRTGRPPHRSQNSFFGRFVRNASAHGSPISPASETSEQFVYVADPKSKNNKALPPPPLDESSTDYPVEKEAEYSDGILSMSGGSNSPGSNGLGRKASLLRKVKDVVRGGGK